MKRSIAAVVVLFLAVAAVAGAEQYWLSDEEYEIYYEVSEYLCADWEAALFDLLDEIAYDYGLTAEELYAFLEYAVFADSEHVWIPVNGGKKFHANAECSKMIDPRPTIKDIAYEYGFTSCGRCKPGS